MANESKIEWTDHTFNPWWGCTKVSPGCANCYAESIAKRYAFKVWGPNAKRKPSSTSYWKQPLRWNEEAKRDGVPHMVFCGSMCDVFEVSGDDVIADAHVRLFPLIQQTPYLRWQLLTKRPENARQVLPGGLADPLPPDSVHNWLHHAQPNVWLGVSAETQEYADLRLPYLLDVPAVVRFVSVEPILGRVSIRKHVACHFCEKTNKTTGLGSGCAMCRGTGRGLHWCIIGGESGPHSRHCLISDMRNLVEECQALGVKVFVKQIGAKAVLGCASTDGKPFELVYAKTKDSKGGNPAEWPASLPRLREFPPLDLGAIGV